MAAHEFAAVGALLVCGLALDPADGGAVAAGLVAVAAAIALFFPVAIIAAIPAALPFVYDPIALAGGRYSLLELAIVLAVASVFVRVMAEVIGRRSVAPVIALMRPWPVTIAVFVLVVVALLSLTWLANPASRSASLRDVRWTVLEPVAGLFVFRWAIRKFGPIPLLGTFLGMAAIVAVAGIVQVGTGRGVVIADGAGRATGPYPHPNNLALYLERAAILALGLAIALTAIRRWTVALALVLGLGLIATLSRGAVLAYAAGACWIVAAARVRNGWRWIVAGGAGVGALFAGASISRLLDSGGSGATSSRELIWHASVRMIEDHPWLGLGPDQFLGQYGRRYIEPAGWPERYTSHPHNLVLDVWLRFGLPGLLMLAFVIGAVVWIARQGPVAQGDRALWVAAIGALIAGLTHGMLDNGYFLPDIAVVTWLLVALIEHSVERNQDRTEATSV